MRARAIGRNATATRLAGLLFFAVWGAQAALLDIDNDGTVAAETDGTLVLRHLFGFQGQALIDGALSAEAGRDTIAIQRYLNDLGDYLDVDADGTADALTDGLLILRRLHEPAISSSRPWETATCARPLPSTRTPTR